MQKQRLAAMLLMVFSLFLYGCNTFAPNDVQINEVTTQIVTSDEIVHLNNCGGKAEARQAAEHSFATNIEGSATLKISPSIIEGSVSARYGQYRDVSKTQELAAPPGTDMEFTLRWTERQWTGTLFANGQSGAYQVQSPISVDLVSSKDLGCSGKASSDAPQPTQQPQVYPLQSFQTETPIPQVPVVIKIDSRRGWQSSGVDIKSGTKLTIDVVNGQWTQTQGKVPYTSGEGGAYICSNTIPANQCVEPLPSFPQGALIGQVDGQIFGVGRGVSTILQQSGILFLRMNDGDNALYDNDGQLTVRITVEQ